MDFLQREVGYGQKGALLKPDAWPFQLEQLQIPPAKHPVAASRRWPSLLQPNAWEISESPRNISKNLDLTVTTETSPGGTVGQKGTSAAGDTRMPTEAESAAVNIGSWPTLSEPESEPTPSQAQQRGWQELFLFLQRSGRCPHSWETNLLQKRE